MTPQERAFKARPKIRALPRAEQERRWKQHEMSEGGKFDKGIAPPAARARERRQTIRGRGDYFTDARNTLARNVPKGTFTTLGKSLGGMLSAPASHVGGWAGDKLARLVGFGDYAVRYNTLLHPHAAEAVAKGAGFAKPGNKVMISHRENMGVFTIPKPAPGVDASPFAETRYRIQPTNTKMFPWLAGIAQNYVQYKVHGLIFSFETTSSPYSAVMGLGTIAFATQHNANSMPYDSMISVLNVENKGQGNPAEDIVHGVECDPALQDQEELFTRRSGDQGPPNLYDFGELTIASEGIPATSSGVVLGQLYVTYQIEFDEAALPPASLVAGQVLCVNGNFTGLPANTPPLGPSLSLQQSHLKTTPNYLMLDVGSTGTEQVQLLQPKAGHYAFPDGSIQEEFDDMLYWFSDDTSTACTQHLGFREPGYYDACIVCSSTVDPVTGGAASHPVPRVTGEGGSLTYYVGTRQYAVATSPTLTVGSDTSWYKIYVPEPALSVSISIPLPTATGTYVSDMVVQPCTKWDTSNPNVLGAPALTAIERRRLKKEALRAEQAAIDLGEVDVTVDLFDAEEVDESGGTWVETKVFIPETATKA